MSDIIFVMEIPFYDLRPPEGYIGGAPRPTLPFVTTPYTLITYKSKLISHLRVSAVWLRVKNNLSLEIFYKTKGVYQMCFF